MIERQQIHIGIHRQKYAKLKEIKGRYEQETGQSVSWGDFLLALCGLSVAISDEEQVAHLAQEKSLDPDIESAIRQQLDSPELATTEAVEEIVRRHTDKVIEELRKLK